MCCHERDVGINDIICFFVRVHGAFLFGTRSCECVSAFAAVHAQQLASLASADVSTAPLCQHLASF